VRIGKQIGLAAVASAVVVSAVAFLVGFDRGASPPARAGEPPAAKNQKADRADGFGYGPAFDDELKRIGQISPQEFAARHPAPTYLGKLSFDPTTAKFWDEFNRADPNPKPDPKRHYQWFDFRLNADELAKFKENGFVVSERMGASSFGEMFYRIYSRDLPVFITSDSMLHAWHRSFDYMLEELEATYLSVALADLLAGMAEAVPAAKAEYGTGPLAESLTDADYFLAVGRSLLSGKPAGTKLNQDARVGTTLNAVTGEKMQSFHLFGRDRNMDFSQFKPRGHYEASEELRRYFKAMMWCGRVDLRVAGGKDATGTLSSPRELGAALVLHDLLKRSGKFDTWRQFDALLEAFIGRVDSATFAHMEALLKESKLAGAAAVKDAKALETLQADILAGKFGLQDVRGDVYINKPGASQPITMPRSFTVLGQRFAVDSWAMSKIVYDDIKWNNELVQRRIPSGLDAAFAALGNDNVVPELVDRMTNGTRKFRDKENYQHNLLAARAVIDRRPAAAWDGTVYDNWLGALRELSEPTTDAKFPEALRTKAWAMKSVNTQLASWTQLRHDTILYVKPSHTTGQACYYPAGFVEPVPAFWGKLETMAAKSADLLAKTPFPDIDVERPMPWDPTGQHKQKVKLKELHKKQVEFLRNFAKQMGVLKEIATKQLDQKELTAAELKVLEDVVQINRGSGITMYNGWYPKLFYKGVRDCADWEPLVADVHTNVPAPPVGDPGCIVHQGVGNIDLLLIAIDSGKDRMVYAGPVLSHYEFETPINNRVSDSEWRDSSVKGKLPPRPEWTKGYLVPGVNPRAKDYAKPRVDE
jgi:hypothetical protein